MSAPSPSRRPGGRTARVRRAVLDAADALVVDEREPISVRRVAELSGISEPTIYRRWRTVQNVLLDAAVRRLSQQSPVPVTGDLRSDLLAWASALEESIAGPAGIRFLSIVVGAQLERDGTAPDTLAPFLQQRVDELRAVLDAGAAPPSMTVERLLDEVLAPLYVRRMLGYTSPKGAAELVDALLC